MIALSGRQRKAALVERGITMTSIASALGITPTQVSEVVAGRRRSERVERAVADAIGRPVEEVFEPRATVAA